MTQNERLKSAILSVEGLAMGDAYGNHHGNNSDKHHSPIWQYSDDTIMALSIVENLRLNEEINQDTLAKSFAFHWDGQRGYGRGATRLLKQIQNGADWKTVSNAMFDGQGSQGNGGAMRVAPIGAYFADDMDKIVKQAELSASVTHTHIEGIAGAIAVAVGAALAFQQKELFNWQSWLDEILDLVPASETHDKIQHAATLNIKTQEAAKILGNGRPSISQTTVPFALWCAGQHMNDFEKAIRQTASVQGDVDTNCAIVGGIVILANDIECIPQNWLTKREALPTWPFADEG